MEFHWVSNGGSAGHSFLLLKGTSESAWLPVDGVRYTMADSSVPGLVYYGSELSFSDSSVEVDKIYYYRLFAADSDLIYSDPVTLTVSLSDMNPGFDGESVPWIDNYIIYYGPLNSEAIETAWKYDLAIIHANNNSITRDQVRQIQKGLDLDDPDDDVLVAAYVAVGEDLRTAGFFPAGASEPDYALMLADERFSRNGIGPRVDPRGPTPEGDALEYNYSIGNASPGGTGFASYYLDDVDLNNGAADGKPDFNRAWRCAFVNAGDPLWFQEVDQMLFDRDGVFGLQELLTTSVGEGLGVDGIFMDALDTCAPNSWTGEGDFVQTEYEWTAPGYVDFIGRLKDKYPDKVVVQNRAVYFFKAGLQQKYLEYSTREHIDFLLFESFRLNSSTTEAFNEQYYYDNRYNYAPHILAEAGREDGFQVLSLGYAEGPSGTLADDLDSGTDNGSLEEDISVTLDLGFRHFLTNIMVDHLNTYVLDKGDLTDNEPPVWSSVYNNQSYQLPPGAPDPRPGILEIEPLGGGVIRVYWDIALDKYPVDYYLYYDTAPLDFENNPTLAGRSRIKLAPRIPEAYRTLSGEMSGALYPFYDDIEDLTIGTTYYFCIRAVDSSENRNMEMNQVTLSYLPVVN